MSSGASQPYKHKAPCPDCAKAVFVNERTGRLYSHQEVGSTSACSASGREVETPSVEGVDPVTPPPLRAAAAEPQPRRQQEHPSESVRTVRGGLPGLGKRR